MQTFKTEQELFWKGEFGCQYVDRHQEERLFLSKTNLMKSILRKSSGISSAIEFGCNVGLNLKALRSIDPEIELSGIEINDKAAEILKGIEGVRVYHESVLNYVPDYPRDLAFTNVVLIHQNPEFLPEFYKKLYHSTKKYLAIAEYFNPTPINVPYRGHQERLFKRDFAADILAQFQGLRLIDYGFAYRHDPDTFYHDDVNWFLMEKVN